MNSTARYPLFHIFLVVALAAWPAVSHGDAGSETAEKAKEVVQKALPVETIPKAMLERATLEMSSTNAENKAWEKASTPGDMHAHLASLVGTWTAHCKYWFTPDQPPHESVSRCTRSMMFGGRFLKQEFDGTFMGKPFQGLGITGYNNTCAQFENVWLDNNGTVINMSKGAMASEPIKTVTMTSSYMDPVSGKIVRNREVTTYPEKDSEIFEMFETKEGVELKTIEIRYSRME